MSTVQGKRRLKEARLALYREHILDAAEEVFAGHGYDAAKVQAIAAKAQVSLATLYGVFPKKWDIFRAVHGRRTQDLLEEVGELVARHGLGGPLDLLLLGISAHCVFHVEHPNYLRMHLREGHAWSAADTLKCQEQIDAWERGLVMMSAAFAEGTRVGLLVDEAPELMARTSIGMTQVRFADWVARGMIETAAELIPGMHSQFIRSFCLPARIPELLREHVPSQPKSVE